MTERPPWAIEPEEKVDTGPVIAEIIEPVKPRLLRIRKPKRGSDVKKPEVFMQVVAHSATHGKTTMPQILGVVEEISISKNLMKKLQAPCPFVPQEVDKAVTSSEAVADRLIQMAVAGDMPAIREVLNRSEGKVPNVTHNESKSLKVSATTDGLAALFGQLDKNA